MKNIKRFIVSIIMISSIIMSSMIFSNEKIREVNADTDKAYYTYQTYKEDDYAVKFPDLKIALEEAFVYSSITIGKGETVLLDVTEAKIASNDYIDFSEVEEYWQCIDYDGDSIYSDFSQADIMSPYSYFGFTISELLVDTTITLIGGTRKNQWGGIEFDFYCPWVTTEFSAGDRIVIEAFVEYTPGYISTCIGIDPRMLEGNSNIFATANAADVIYYDTLYAGEVPLHGINGVAVAVINNEIKTGVKVIQFGGNFNGSDVVYTKKSNGAIGITIADTASGTYQIQAVISDGTNIILEDSTCNRLYSHSNFFVNTPFEIKVVGDSTNAVIDESSIKLDGSKYTSSSTDSTTGLTKYEFADCAYNATSASLAVAAAENGTIKSVEYTTTAGATSGTAVSSTNGKYNIPLGDSGSTTYAIVTVEAQTGGATTQYIMQISKAKNSSASVTDIKYTVYEGTTVTTSNLLNTTTGSETEFKTNVLKYTIQVPSSATTIKFTPEVDYGSYMTCTVNGNSVTSSNPSYTITISNTTNVKILVTSQDSTTSVQYEYSIVVLSDDNKLSSLVIKANDTQLLYSKDDDTNTYTVVDPVAYTTEGFTITPTANNDKATITVNGVSVTSGTASSAITFGDSINEVKKTIEVIVTSQSQKKQTYYVVVTRTAANTNNTLKDFSVYDNNGTEIAGEWNGNTWKNSDTLSFDTTKFYIVATASDDAKGKSTAKFNSTSYTWGSNSSDISFGSNTSATATLVITSESGVSNTLTIQLTKASANDDDTFTYTLYDSNGTSIEMNVSDSGEVYTSKNTLSNSIEYVNLTVTPTVSTTSVTINNSDYTSKAYKATVEYVKNNSKVTSPQVVISVILKTQATNTTTIKFTINFEAYSSDCSVESVTVVGKNDNATYTATSTTNDNYKYQLPQSSAGDYYKLTVVPTDADNAVIRYSTNASALTSVTDGSEYYDGVELSIGTVYYVTIFAQYTGSTKTITITVEHTDTRDTDSSITNIATNVDLVDANGNKYSFNADNANQGTFYVAYSVTQVEFTIELGSKKATLAQGSSGIKTLSSGTNTFKFQAKAENTTLGTEYTIKIVRNSAETGNSISDITVNSNNITFSQKKAVYLLDRDQNITAASFVVTVSKNASWVATYTLNESTHNEDTNFTINGLSFGSYLLVTISVKSEKDTIDKNSTTNEYKVYLVSASNNSEITNIKMLAGDEYGSNLKDINNNEFTFNSSSNTGTFNIAYASENPYFVVETSSQYANISGNGLLTVSKSTTSSTSAEATITAKSEYYKILEGLGLSDSNASSTTYKYRITRNQASTDTSIDEIRVVINGNEYVIDGTDTFPYTIENLGNATSANITVKTNDDNAKVSGIGDGKVNLSLPTSTSTQTLQITVTSESGATKDYQIILANSSAKLDEDNTISNIEVIGGVTGDDYLVNKYTSFLSTQTEYNFTIRSSEKRVTINVTPTSSLASVYFDGTNSGSKSKSISLTAGETYEISIVCYAQDGTSSDITYTIKIECPQDDTDNTLKQLKFNNVNIADFDPEKTEYTINVLNSVETALLTPTLNSSNAKITQNDAEEAKSLVLGKNPFYIFVQSEAGKTKTYKVTVIRDALTTLDSLEIEDEDGETLEFSPEFSSTETSYSGIEIPYKQTSVKVYYKATYSSYVTVTVANNTNLEAGKTTKVIVTVTAASGACTEYKVSVKRLAGSDSCDITKYVKEDGTEATDFSNPYSYVIEKTNASTMIFNPTIEVSEGASYQLPAENTISVGKNVFTITVTSETGKTKNYSITVYYVSTNYDIKDIVVKESASGEKLKDADGNEVYYSKDNAGVYSYTVPYKQSNAYFIIETKDSNAKIYLNNGITTSGVTKSLDVGKNTFTVYAISEYGYYNSYGTNIKSTVYTFEITREEADTNNLLKDLQVLVDGNNLLQDFDPENSTYTITNVSSTSIEIVATLPDGSKAEIISGTGTKEITQDGQEFNVVVKPESGSNKTYTITILKGDVPLDEDNRIIYIDVIVDGELYLTKTSEDGAEQFSSTKTEYEYTIPYGTKSVSIQGFKANLSLATVSDKIVLTLSDSSSYWGTTKEYKVFATSQKNIKGTEYTISLTFEEGNNDSSLEYIKINGTLLSDFDPEQFSYNLDTVDNSVTYISIDAKPTAETSNVVENSKYVDFTKSEYNNAVSFIFNLEEGNNTITITVKAQVGTSSYTINVKRSEALPTLMDLKVEGSSLFDEEGNIVSFDKAINKYVAILPYSVGTSLSDGMADIKVTVDNINYLVTCTNTVRDTVSSTDSVIVFRHTTLEAGTDNVVYITINLGTVENTYELVIRRKAAPNSDAGITDIEINDTIEDFVYVAGNNNYTITVPNSVNDLDVTAYPSSVKTETSDGASINYINDKNLKIGENKVLVIVTAEDGVTQKVVELTVIREAMEYKIDKDATSYQCTLDETLDNVATIDLGKKNSSAISDYTTYIDTLGNDHLTVTVLNQDAVSKGEASQVILQICDGTNIEYVTLTLSTATSGQMSFIVWILLIIAIIILIIILASVMKDKYGSISKSRKKD